MPPIFDDQIVRGQRIGPVSVGMTKAQLLQHVGTPTQTLEWEGGEQYTYEALQLSVFVRDGEVASVSTVPGGKYSIEGMVREGVSESDVKAKLGVAAWIKEAGHDHWTYCYAEGTKIIVKDGLVIEIRVVKRHSLGADCP